MPDDKLFNSGDAPDRYGGRDARQLSRQLHPERDLWPAIAAQISTSSTPIRWPSGSPWQQLAAAGVLMLISSLATLWLSDRIGLPDDRVVANAAPEHGYIRETLPANFGALSSLDVRYRQDRASLGIALMLQLEQLPDETRAGVLDNLAAIHRAIAEINSALEQDPNNLLLQQLLMTTYQDELLVLNNVNRMIASSPARSRI